MASARPRTSVQPDLSAHLLRVTEAAAVAAARHAGKKNKDLVDQAAVDAMRAVLRTVPMDGLVVIGEGEKDEAPMLSIDEQVGKGSPPQMDVAVDPIDGTALLAAGLPGAIAVMALAPRGAMRCPREVYYVRKIVVGPGAKDAIDITAPTRDNLRNVAHALGRRVDSLTAAVLDRSRNADLLDEVRTAGARVRLISADVTEGVHAALQDGVVDVVIGIGGVTESVLVAAAVRCLGGAIQCLPWPRDGQEKARALAAGLDLDRVFTTDDLVGKENVFFAATGATTSDLLQGVEYRADRALTYSLAVSTVPPAIRWVKSVHVLPPKIETADMRLLPPA